MFAVPWCSFGRDDNCSANRSPYMLSPILLASISKGLAKAPDLCPLPSWSLPSTLHLLLPKEDGAQDTPPKLLQDQTTQSQSPLCPVFTQWLLGLIFIPTVGKSPQPLLPMVMSLQHSPISLLTSALQHVSPSSFKSPLTLPITAHHSPSLHWWTENLHFKSENGESRSQFEFSRQLPQVSEMVTKGWAHIQPSHVSVCALWDLDQSPGLCHIPGPLTLSKTGTLVSHALDLTLWYF